MSVLPSPDNMSSTTTATQNSLPPVDLRHMTSNVVLTSPTKDHRTTNRVSQLLRTSDARLGSRSPNSIPSSPTSVHSSSSAIFERDIEPISPPSPPFLPHHPPNPHRIPRAKATEHLEQSVPSVLDSAASILASLEDFDAGDQVAVVAPASSTLEAMGRSSGFASPIGSFRSRSPSPLGCRLGAGTGGSIRNDLLFSIPHHNQTLSTPIPAPAQATVPSSTPPQSTPAPSAPPASASPPARPTIQTTTNTTTPVPETNNVTPSIVTPTSAYFSTTSSVTAEDTASTATLESAPLAQHESPSPSNAPIPLSPSHISSPLSTTTSHPPSPTHVATKRLSFMSYSDLLSSTPATTQPLSSFTTSASSNDPPPHIPGVSGLTLANAHQAGSAAASLRGFVMGPPGGVTHAGKRDSIALLDDVGGEWEREGLGRGLEERLEVLMPPVVNSKA